MDGLESFSSREREIRQEFIEQWGLSEALEKLNAVGFSSIDDLQPGDLIIRRWGDGETGKRSGNSTIYLAPIDDTTVWGIECNRLYHEASGERMDGVIYRYLRPISRRRRCMRAAAKGLEVVSEIP